MNERVAIRIQASPLLERYMRAKDLILEPSPLERYDNRDGDDETPVIIDEIRLEQPQQSVIIEHGKSNNKEFKRHQEQTGLDTRGPQRTAGREGEYHR